MDDKTTKPSRTQDMLPAFWVAFFVFMAFLPTLTNGWVDWDDPSNYIDNFHFKGLGLSQLRWIFAGSFGFMGNYEPLHWLSMAVTYQLWGLRAGGYHLTALLFPLRLDGGFLFSGLESSSRPPSRAGSGSGVREQASRLLGRRGPALRPAPHARRGRGLASASTTPRRASSTC